MLNDRKILGERNHVSHGGEIEIQHPIIRPGNNLMLKRLDHVDLLEGRKNNKNKTSSYPVSAGHMN